MQGTTTSVVPPAPESKPRRARKRAPKPQRRETRSALPREAQLPAELLEANRAAILLDMPMALPAAYRALEAYRRAGSPPWRRIDWFDAIRSASEELAVRSGNVISMIEWLRAKVRAGAKGQAP